MSHKRIVHALVPLAATILLLSCGARTDTSLGEFSEGMSAQHHAAVQAADAVIDAADIVFAAEEHDRHGATQAAVAEMRHFDIYNRYIPLFERPAVVLRALAQDGEDDQFAIMTLNGAIPVCTKRALLAN
ncbi:hypothetical protein EGT07_06415 [Herbaspirillum sp. HC18]|nr:hypothetical protein EGT07_06415 [Herbaspirillum sp. HC18]